MSARHKAIYGNVVLDRVFCDFCHCYSFVIDGLKQCCDEPCIENDTPERRQMVQAERRRQRPPKWAQTAILNKQNHCCFYCGTPFGNFYVYRDKLYQLKPCWDHVAPWVFSFNNQAVNFVASCALCNNMKSAKMFDTLAEARAYVQEKRAKAKNLRRLQSEVLDESEQKKVLLCEMPQPKVDKRQSAELPNMPLSDSEADWELYQWVRWYVVIPWVFECIFDFKEATQ